MATFKDNGYEWGVSVEVQVFIPGTNVMESGRPLRPDDPLYIPALKAALAEAEDAGEGWWDMPEHPSLEFNETLTKVRRKGTHADETDFWKCHLADFRAVRDHYVKEG